MIGKLITSAMVRRPIRHVTRAEAGGPRSGAGSDRAATDAADATNAIRPQFDKAAAVSAGRAHDGSFQLFSSVRSQPINVGMTTFLIFGRPAAARDKFNI